MGGVAVGVTVGRLVTVGDGVGVSLGVGEFVAVGVINSASAAASLGRGVGV